MELERFSHKPLVDPGEFRDEDAGSRGRDPHFASGQWFTYGLEDLGNYYRDYVELMAHFDEVLPGRVGRMFHETLVADPEAEIRRLLRHCGLPFEPASLRFYENDRATLTASSERVHQPISRAGVDHWRHYEPWLEPLRRGLGDVLTEYPTLRHSPWNRAAGQAAKDPPPAPCVRATYA